MLSMISGNEMNQEQGISFIRRHISMVLGTGIRQGGRSQWRWLQGLNGCALAGVALGGFISVIGARHVDFLLGIFVGL